MCDRIEVRVCGGSVSCVCHNGKSSVRVLIRDLDLLRLYIPDCFTLDDEEFDANHDICEHLSLVNTTQLKDVQIRKK